MKSKFDKAFAKQGFTIVELLLYVAIVSVIVLTLSVFISVILSTREKGETIATVDEEGAAAMRLITQTIRNSKTINTPLQGASAATLSLEEINAPQNPSVFDLSGGSIRIKEGTGAALNLTSSLVSVSNLSFYNLSRTNSFGTVRVQFTIARTNPNNKNEYDYSRTFYGTASLR